MKALTDGPKVLVDCGVLSSLILWYIERADDEFVGMGLSEINALQADIAAARQAQDQHRG